MTEEHLDDAVELVCDEITMICDPSDYEYNPEMYVELAAEQVGVMVTPQIVAAVMSRLNG